MTNENLYLTALDLIRKDTKGRAFTVKEFNRVLPFVTNEYFNQQYDKYEKSQLSTDSLSPFRVNGEVLVLVGGKAEIKSGTHEYMHMSGRPAYADGTEIRRVDMVTELEYDTRSIDELTQPTTADPVGVIRDTNYIYIYPTAPPVVSITLSFFHKPVVPILDYYMDGSYNRVYLAVGATHVVVAGEEYPLAAAPPAVGSTYNSQTIEMEWNDFDRPNILFLILRKMGVAMDDQLIAQYGVAMQDKTDVT